MTLTENSSVVTNDTQGPQKSTPPEIASVSKHGTKTNPVFLPADGKVSWSLLPSLDSLLSGSTVQAENTYSRILKETGQV